MGLEPIDGADELFIPFNMTPISDTGRDAAPVTIPPPEEPANPDEEAEALAGKVIERIKEKLGVIPERAK